jgi:hypothetical protein
MEDKSKSQKNEERVPEEIRFKYIGFEVYPKKPKRFWKTEEEKRGQLEEIKKKGSRSALEDRDYSLVRAAVFSKVDRLILTITSLILTVSIVLPWFSLRGEGFNSSVLGVGFFLKLGMLFGYAPLSGPLFSVLVILVGLTIFFSFVAGLLSLLAMYRKYDQIESYLSNLKRNLRLNFIPLILWVVLIVILVMGMSTPFAGIFGVDGLGDGFTVVNFFLLSSYGIWLSLPSVIINCVKVSDL